MIKGQFAGRELPEIASRPAGARHRTGGVVDVLSRSKLVGLSEQLLGLTPAAALQEIVFGLRKAARAVIEFDLGGGAAQVQGLVPVLHIAGEIGVVLLPVVNHLVGAGLPAVLRKLDIALQAREPLIRRADVVGVDVDVPRLQDGVHHGAGEKVGVRRAKTGAGGVLGPGVSSGKQAQGQGPSWPPSIARQGG